MKKLSCCLFALLAFPILSEPSSLKFDDKTNPYFIRSSEWVEVNDVRKYWVALFRINIELQGDELVVPPNNSYLIATDGDSADVIPVKGIDISLKTVDFNDDGKNELLVDHENGSEWELYAIQEDAKHLVPWVPLEKLNKVDLVSDYYDLKFDKGRVSFTVKQRTDNDGYKDVTVSYSVMEAFDFH